MSRLPYQVLVIPYRYRDGLEVCIFNRSTSDMVQWVSGGGEDSEIPYEAACRELYEEAGVRTVDLMSLRSMCYIPSFNYKEIRDNYPNVTVVPEYAFACEVNDDIVLSEEHESFEWVSCQEAMERLTWDSNKTALHELKRRLDSSVEYWDVYNNKRERLEKIAARDKYDLDEGEYHLVVVTWICDSQNRLLMQRRSYNKDLLPGLIATHGGSAVTGESSIVGAFREVYEEIGVACNFNDMRLFYTQFKENCLYDTYFVRMDVDLDDVVIDPEEVDSCMYLTYDEMFEMMDSGECYDYRKGQGMEYLELLKKEIEK